MANNVLREHHHDGEHLWTIEAYDDQPVPDGKKYAADRRVVVLLNGERVREFIYPSYRIWTLLAHWTEGLDDLRAALDPGTRDQADQGTRQGDQPGRFGDPTCGKAHP